MPEKIILTESAEQTAALFGELDANLEKLEAAFGVTIRSSADTSGTGDAVSVSGVYQRLELCLCTEVPVGLGVVKNIVAVVGIVRKVTVAGVNIAVDLLVRSGDPKRVYAEVIEITLVDLLGKTLEVAAVEGAGSGLPAAERVSVGVKSSAVGVVV